MSGILGASDRAAKASQVSSSVAAAPLCRKRPHSQACPVLGGRERKAYA